MPDHCPLPADLAIGEALASAPAAKLGRVVGVLDSLNDRGAADALLAAARPRLRDLRPLRPLRFTRLLALPLEPVLVATEDWAGDPAHIPRAALTPLGAAMRSALGDLAEEIEVAALGRTMADAALVARLGARLWPRVARLCVTLPLPGWGEAGLPESAATPLLALARQHWAQAAEPGSIPAADRA